MICKFSQVEKLRQKDASKFSRKYSGTYVGLKDGRVAPDALQSMDGLHIRTRSWSRYKLSKAVWDNKFLLC